MPRKILLFNSRQEPVSVQGEELLHEPSKSSGAVPRGSLRHGCAPPAPVVDAAQDSDVVMDMAEPCDFVDKNALGLTATRVEPRGSIKSGSKKKWALDRNQSFQEDVPGSTTREAASRQRRLRALVLARHIVRLGSTSPCAKGLEMAVRNTVIRMGLHLPKNPWLIEENSDDDKDDDEPKTVQNKPKTIRKRFENAVGFRSKITRKKKAKINDAGLNTHT